MRLKILTSASFFGGILMLILWPFILGPKPAENAAKKVLAEYGVKLLAFFFFTALLFLAAMVFAYLLARQTKVEFLKEMKTNVEELVEGSLNDHKERDPS